MNTQIYIHLTTSYSAVLNGSQLALCPYKTGWDRETLFVAERPKTWEINRPILLQAEIFSYDTTKTDTELTDTHLPITFLPLSPFASLSDLLIYTHSPLRSCSFQKKHHILAEGPCHLIHGILESILRFTLVYIINLILFLAVLSLSYFTVVRHTIEHLPVMHIPAGSLSGTFSLVFTAIGRLIE